MGRERKGNIYFITEIDVGDFFARLLYLSSCLLLNNKHVLAENLCCDIYISHIDEDLEIAQPNLTNPAWYEGSSSEKRTSGQDNMDSEDSREQEGVRWVPAL